MKQSRKNTASYISPDDCHSPRSSWTLLKVLEDRGAGQISLAIGRWDGTPCLAVRWNGSTESPIGNPQSRGLPTWFILPKDYTEMILKTLPEDKQTLARNFIPEPTKNGL